MEDIKGNKYNAQNNPTVYRPPQFADAGGRFPANLLVSGDALNDGKVDKGTKPHPVKSNVEKYEGWGTITKKQGEIVNYGDSGSFSRYFDLDAWARHNGFLNVPKAGTGEREYGLYSQPLKSAGTLNGSADETLNKRTNFKSPKRRNIHPTVKPVELMAYLIELGCPRGGVVLDPFVGSGTTCVAAKKLGRRFIGIEIDESSHRIAVARVAAEPMKLEDVKNGG